MHPEVRTDDDTAHLYAQPFDHTRWPDHRIRVAVTSALAAAEWAGKGVESIADLSAGDGAIASRVWLGLEPRPRLVLGDRTPHPELARLASAGAPLVGSIRENLTRIAVVGGFICSETLEHVVDPDALLRAIRKKSHRLLLSTPVEAPEGEPHNPEHLWTWDRSGVEAMMLEAGWVPGAFVLIDWDQPEIYPYSFGVWVAE